MLSVAYRSLSVSPFLEGKILSSHLYLVRNNGRLNILNSLKTSKELEAVGLVNDFKWL